MTESIEHHIGCCVCYPVLFQKDRGEAEIMALIDFGSEVNAMNPAYAAKLGLRVQRTDVGSQKIDGSSLDTYGMIIAVFQVLDKFGRLRFFQEIFLLADINIKVVFDKLFLTFSNIDVQFTKKKLT